MTLLVLLPQGGLGNQLIQYGYAQSLASRVQVAVQVNQILLGATWAHIRGVSFRPLSPWLKSFWPMLQGRHRRGLDLMLSKLGRLQNHLLQEGWNDGQIIQTIETAPREHRLWMLGYYQRQQAFSDDANPLWRHVADQLQAKQGLSPHPPGRVAVHVRLGDYLLPTNQRLFALLPVHELVTNALNWREQLGGDEPVSIFTDSPDLLAAQLEQSCTNAQRHQLQIESHGSAQEDFRALLQYRHIVASNSTFSLCAGKFSSLLWGNSHGATLLLPPRWYANERLDFQQRQELGACQFTKTTPT